MGSNQRLFFFFKSWLFLLITNTGKDAPAVWSLDVQERSKPGSLAAGSSKVHVSRRGLLGFYSLLSKTQAVFPPEEHVMCKNIRDIAKWLRDITVEIFHQSINLPSLPSLPTQRDNFSQSLSCSSV